MSVYSSLLQVIFVVILFGIVLILIKPEDADPVKKVIYGLNEVVMKLIDMIMLGAPFGVFALIAGLVVEAPSVDLFKALLWYSLTVIIVLSFLLFVMYQLIVLIVYVIPFICDVSTHRPDRFGNYLPQIF